MGCITSILTLPASAGATHSLSWAAKAPTRRGPSAVHESETVLAAQTCKASAEFDLSLAASTDQVAQVIPTMSNKELYHGRTWLRWGPR